MAILDITKPLENVFLNGELWEKSNGQAPYAWKRTSYEMVDITDEVNDNKTPLDSVVVSTMAKNCKWYSSSSYTCEGDHFKFDEAILVVLNTVNAPMTKQFLARQKMYVYVDKIQDESDTKDKGIPNQTSKYLIEVPADCTFYCKRYGVDDAGNLNAQYPEQTYITVPNTIGINGRVTVYTMQPKVEYVVDINPDKYPDGGEQDGYYYEKVVQNYPYVWEKYEITQTPAIINERQNDLPYDFSNASAVVYNNEIHILGTDTDSNNYFSHYSLNLENDTWHRCSTLPYSFRKGCAVVYNGEIHILGGFGNTNKHYKWNGTGWTSVSTLPYSVYMSCAVVHNNEIHILGGSSSTENTLHYKWNGTEWISVSTLPYTFTYGVALTYRNELHIMTSSTSGNTNKHYKWNGTEWISMNTLPSGGLYVGGAVVLRDRIRLYSTKNTYTFDGETWQQDDIIRDYIFMYGSIVEINQTVHLLGSSGTDNKKFHYVYDGFIKSYAQIDTVTSSDINEYPTDGEQGGFYYKRKAKPPFAWGKYSVNGDDKTFIEYVTDKNPLRYPNGEVADDGFFYRYANEGVHVWNKSTFHTELDADILKLQNDLPYILYQGSAVEFNGELHILGGSGGTKGHYKWNGVSWIDLGELPYNFYQGSAVVYNNEIHIIGGIDNYVTLHYKWDGSSWTNVGVLPYSFSQGGCVVYHNKIHILGSAVNGQLSDGTYYYSCHYSFDGSAWTREANVYDFFHNGGCVVYNDEIHLLGNYGSPSYDYHYKWDGSSWTKLNNMPYHFRQGQAVVFENKIHILGSYDFGTEHRVWDEASDSWIERTKKLPNNYYKGCAIALSDGLHILGTYASTSSLNTHYIVDGYKTVYVPFDIVVSDNENAYPDNGEYDGYFYTLGGFRVGTITQTASNKTTLEIPYGNNSTPKAFFVTHMGGCTSSEVSYLVYATWYDGEDNNGAYAFYSSPYVRYTTGSGGAICSVSFSNGVATLGGSNYYYGTYKWIAVF